MTTDDRTCNCGKPLNAVDTICPACADTLAQALGDVPWLDEQLDISATRAKGIDYRTLGNSGKGAKKPSERPLPGNRAASEAQSHLRAILVSWSLLLADEHDGRDNLPADNLPAISRWLMWRIDYLARHDVGQEAHDEITAAVNRCRRVIDRRPDRWYAGPCNECDADVYANTKNGDCACECGAVYDVKARRDWLIAEAEDRLADATTIARAVSWLGTQPLTAARVRKWAERDRIAAKGHDGRRPLYRIGDAITLLAQEAKSA